MADRSKYVDIFFRNGLKEFEVLPPPDVWDNIKPMLRKREKTLNLYRLAAVAAILISLSGFSYWLTRQISDNFGGPAISLNQESIPAGSYVQKNQPIPMPPVLAQTENTGNPSSIIINDNSPQESNSLELTPQNVITLALKEGNLSRSFNRNYSNNEISVKSGYRTIEKPVLPLPVAGYEKQDKGINRWSLSAMASPNYYSAFNTGNSQTSSDLSDGEKSVVSYSGGMALAYKLNKRVSIQSGIFYSSVGKEVTGISTFSGFSKYYDAKGTSGFSVQTSNGLIVSTNSNLYLRDNVATRVETRYTSDIFDPTKSKLTYLDNSINQNFNYLEIPLLFKYKAIDRKIDVTVVGGLSYNMLVGNSAFANVNGVKYSIGKTEGLNPFNFSSSFGVGFEYSFSQKISLGLEPTFRYYLTPFGNVAGSSGHPYGLGIFTGLSYKF